MTGTEELHGGTAPLAALTTIFTPPCPTTWLLTTTKLPSQNPPFPSAGPSSCDPPAWNQNLEGAGFDYYSPAICPSGFSVGPFCYALVKTRTSEGFPAVASGESVAYCVPSGLTCTTDTTDFRGGVWGFSKDRTLTGVVTVGPAIQIRWVEADLKILETHPLKPGLAPTGVRAGVIPETTTRRLTIVEVTTGLQETSTESGDQQTTTKKTTGTTRQPITLTSDNTPNTSPTTDQTSRSSSTTTTDPVNDSKPTSDTTMIEQTETTTLSGSITPVDGSPSIGADSGRGSGLLDRGTSIILIVMLSLLVGVAIWIISFVLIRRRKAGKLTGFRPSALVRLRIRRGRVYRRCGNSTCSTTCILPHDRIAGADIGFTELESGPPRGTTPNPAELEGRGIGDPPVRWSWISAVSRLLHTGRAARQGSDHSGRLSTPRSGEKPPTFRESFGEKINDPAAILSRPEALRTRSTLTASPTVSTGRGSSPWSRSSRDTFGVPKVPSKIRTSEQKVLVDGSNILGLRKERSK